MQHPVLKLEKIIRILTLINKYEPITPEPSITAKSKRKIHIIEISPPVETMIAQSTII